jgi:hypothetical protein
MLELSSPALFPFRENWDMREICRLGGEERTVDIES